MKRARGSTILMVMLLLLSLLALGSLFALRLETTSSGTRSQEERLVALWLARSAVSSRVEGLVKVTTSVGEAVVQVSSANRVRAAVATVSGCRASVSETETGWIERFERESPH